MAFSNCDFYSGRPKNRGQYRPQPRNHLHTGHNPLWLSSSGHNPLWLSTCKQGREKLQQSHNLEDEKNTIEPMPQFAHNETGHVNTVIVHLHFVFWGVFNEIFGKGFNRFRRPSRNLCKLILCLRLGEVVNSFALALAFLMCQW